MPTEDCPIASFTFSGVLPSVAKEVAPPVGSFTFSSVLPPVSKEAPAPIISFVLSGITPSTAHGAYQVAPAVLLLSPAVPNTSKSATSPVASLILSAFIPILDQPLAAIVFYAASGLTLYVQFDDATNIRLPLTPSVSDPRRYVLTNAALQAAALPSGSYAPSIRQGNYLSPTSTDPILSSPEEFRWNGQERVLYATIGDIPGPAEIHVGPFP